MAYRYSDASIKPLGQETNYHQAPQDLHEQGGYSQGRAYGEKKGVSKWVGRCVAMHQSMSKLSCLALFHRLRLACQS